MQIEGTVVKTRGQVPSGPATCFARSMTAADGLMMRFFNFYPSQQKVLAPGARVRVMGEIRQGFFGAEMVHPRFRVLRGEVPLPQALTPVYPTTAGLGQDTLRKLVGHALERDRPRGHAAGTDAEKAQNAAVRGSGPCAAQPDARRGRCRRWSNTPIRPGAGSSSTNCWRSNCPCDCIATAATACARIPCCSIRACRSTCWGRCRSGSPAHRRAHLPKSAAISRARTRCSACCRVTSAVARLSWPRSRRCRPSRADIRQR